MKAQLCQAALLIISTAVTSSPTLAQSKQVAFYCSRTIQNEPETVVRVKGKEGTRTIVEWKNKVKDMSDSQSNSFQLKRCETASKNFQAAWDRGNFNHLNHGKNKDGRGVICAASSREKACQENNILFTLNNAKQAEDILSKLRQTIKGTVSQPIYQSNSEISIDMQELIKSISDSAEK
jgi:Circadian oscillating protein COP23